MTSTTKTTMINSIRMHSVHVDLCSNRCPCLWRSLGSWTPHRPVTWPSGFAGTLKRLKPLPIFRQNRPLQSGANACDWIWTSCHPHRVTSRGGFPASPSLRKVGVRQTSVLWKESSPAKLSKSQQRSKSSVDLAWTQFWIGEKYSMSDKTMLYSPGNGNLL